jgi:hypothetical protein
VGIDAMNGFLNDSKNVFFNIVLILLTGLSFSEHFFKN